MIEIHNRRRPKFAAQFLSRYHLARRFEQHNQQSKWLLLKADAFALLLQFAGLNVGFEGAKAQKRGRSLVGVHGKPLAYATSIVAERGRVSPKPLVLFGLAGDLDSSE